MSASSNNAQVASVNYQPDATLDPNAAPNLNATTNSSADSNFVLVTQVVLPNRGVGLSLAVHANIGLGNLSGIAET